MQAILRYSFYFYGSDIFKFLVIIIYLLDDALEYIKLWTEPLKELAIHEGAVLIKTPCWIDLKASMVAILNSTEYDFEVKLNNQTGYLIDFCSADKLREWRTNNVSIVDRWVDLFKHLHASNCDYGELSIIAEYILCLPGTNCSVEWLFASAKVTWTSSKTNLMIKTLRAILMIKCNFKQNCIEFYHYLLKIPKLLQQIASKEKYKIVDDNNLAGALTDSEEDSE